ncbi:N/A [soil metagenome]
MTEPARPQPNKLFLQRLLASRTSAELVKYLVTGMLNTVLTFLVYAAGLYVFRIHYLVALIAAYLVGILFSYFVNFVWVFQPEERFAFHFRFIKFLIPNAATFVVNLLMLHVIVRYWGGDPFLSQIGLAVVVVAINFMFAKFLAFRR